MIDRLNMLDRLNNKAITNYNNYSVTELEGLLKNIYGLHHKNANCVNMDRINENLGVLASLQKKIMKPISVETDDISELGSETPSDVSPIISTPQKSNSEPVVAPATHYTS